MSLQYSIQWEQFLTQDVVDDMVNKCLSNFILFISIYRIYCPLTIVTDKMLLILKHNGGMRYHLYTNLK